MKQSKLCCSNGLPDCRAAVFRNVLSPSALQSCAPMAMHIQLHMPDRPQLLYNVDADDAVAATVVSAFMLFFASQQ